ncbi:PH domain-containing protein [Sphingomonas jaspsi]|uniref:PH domain-containing protein n=1 Tax=Sphingomonas jaspsi TaxID=392409 RepID=UPI00055B72B2|nr:PH domain-containing protein [Sphingomonas jaspsi]
MTVAVPSDLRPVEVAYKTSLRVRALLFWLPLLIGSFITDRLLLAETGWGGLAPSLVVLFAFAGAVYAPGRVYRRLGYALDDRLLRVVRGWMFHTDTVVPFVKVQHIDVTRGPIDKLFDLASLVVHTAGTHNSVVTLPGLSPETATSIRDAIRAEIRADAE